MIGRAVSEPLPYFSLTRADVRAGGCADKHVAGYASRQRDASGRGKPGDTHGLLGRDLIDISASMPLSMNIRPWRAGERGEILIRAESEALAATTWYLRERPFLKLSDDPRHVRLLLPMATRCCKPAKLLSRKRGQLCQRAWLIMVSTRMVVCRRPVADDKFALTRPIGIIASIAMIPVCTGWLTAGVDDAGRDLLKRA